MAQVRVVLLGPLAELAGERERDHTAATVAEVLEQVSSTYGAAFAAMLDRSRPFVNGELADESVVLCDGDELALVPPVSGG